MSVKEFAEALYGEMKNKLEEISDNNNNALQTSRDSSTVILQFISRLKAYMINYKFTSPEEEIDFFKRIKPGFISKMIYHQKVFEIQSRQPVATASARKHYYIQELLKINRYINANKEFFMYFKSKSTRLDDVYFLRKEPDSWLLLNFEDYETDLSFTTVFDHKLSKIIAYELLSGFILACINKMETIPEVSSTITGKSSLKWTGSKASLIELMYALQSTGSCNNGTIDLKNLANYFEHFFNVELGNYYRVFQEIRIRKISRTTFIDQLKDRLIKRMDEADENPKRY